MSVLLDDLVRLERAHPLARKQLVCHDVNHGRELLFALAQRTGGWGGWEAVTLRTLAESLAFVALADRALTIADDLAITALCNSALDRCVSARAVSDDFAAQAGRGGFRRVVRDAVLTLRTAGCVPAAAARLTIDGPAAARDTATVLAEYERLLAETGLADPATLFTIAADVREEEGAYVLADVIAIAPSVAARGRPGELLDWLRGRGAVTLACDAVVGVDAAGAAHVARSPLSWVLAPTELLAMRPADDAPVVEIDYFAGATPEDEVREVLRRVIAERLAWDQVEIVATDPDTYGVALEDLAARLEIGVTSLHGVPLPRTRIGRALVRYLEWLESGLDVDVVRQALEAGELSAPGDHSCAPVRLARTLRRLGIGWGRARYEAALGRSPDDPQTRDVAPLLRALLDAAPEVPAPGPAARPVSLSPAELSRRALVYLALVRTHGEAEATVMSRLRARLERIAELETRVTTFGAALATVREHVAELRAWSATDERKPWSANGGCVHLTDLAHAGATARRRTFVVGLDAARSAATIAPEPILTDGVRRAIDERALPTSATRLAERRQHAARSLAGLRGRVTLSWATTDGLDGRVLAPSALVLQAFRATSGDVARSYDDLRVATGAPASSVPAEDARCLDQRDAWLLALSDGALLLDGGALVRAGHAGLDQGLTALGTWHDATLTAHQGMVPAAAGALDPRDAPDRPISPSSLELLAACPAAWFYRYGLGLHAPGDDAFDPDAWLDAAGRGSLLHDVYERFVQRYLGRQHEIVHDDAERALAGIVDEALAAWRARVPPPSEHVVQRESEEIHRSARAFLAMERDAVRAGDGTWLHTELSFEASDDAGVPIRGRIDRVDRMPDGTLRVIDYKTGSDHKYRPTKGEAPFRAGRTLQAALYARAAAQRLGAPVSVAEYRFPTVTGRNEIARYDASDLAEAESLVRSVLSATESGAFVPTTDQGDCKFCEYAAVCRVSTDGYGKTASPRAAWASDVAPQLPEYAEMLRRRQVEAGA